jgi:hypothetical protein
MLIYTSVTLPLLCISGTCGRWQCKGGFRSQAGSCIELLFLEKPHRLL